MSKRKSFERRFWQAADSFIENAVTKNLLLTQAIGICPIIAAGITLQKGVTLTYCTAAVLIPLGLLMPLIGNRLPRWLRYLPSRLRRIDRSRYSPRPPPCRPLSSPPYGTRSSPRKRYPSNRARYIDHDH